MHGDPGSSPYPPSHLFLLRLWVERPGKPMGEIRIQVRHILSGETRYFRDLLEVATYLQARIGADTGDFGADSPH